MAGKQRLDQTQRIVLGLFFVFICSDETLLVAVGLALGLLVLLLVGLVVYCQWRKKKDQGEYQELLSTVPSVPACSAPMILVSQGCCTTLVQENMLYTKLGTNNF